ncbi:MAG: hypothetical protein IKH26_06295 [Bacteroidaceae bacterium]|nr:hypothetical protein [Bacteroidaceae bacterium]
MRKNYGLVFLMMNNTAVENKIPTKTQRMRNNSKEMNSFKNSAMRMAKTTVSTIADNMIPFFLLIICLILMLELFYRKISELLNINQTNSVQNEQTEEFREEEYNGPYIR